MNWYEKEIVSLKIDKFVTVPFIFKLRYLICNHWRTEIENISEIQKHRHFITITERTGNGSWVIRGEGINRQDE